MKWMCGRQVQTQSKSCSTFVCVALWHHDLPGLMRSESTGCMRRNRTSHNQGHPRRVPPFLEKRQQHEADNYSTRYIHNFMLSCAGSNAKYTIMMSLTPLTLLSSLLALTVQAHVHHQQAFSHLPRPGLYAEAQISL